MFGDFHILNQASSMLLKSVCLTVALIFLNPYCVSLQSTTNLEVAFSSQSSSSTTGLMPSFGWLLKCIEQKGIIQIYVDISQKGEETSNCFDRSFLNISKTGLAAQTTNNKSRHEQQIISEVCQHREALTKCPESFISATKLCLPAAGREDVDSLLLALLYAFDYACENEGERLREIINTNFGLCVSQPGSILNQSLIDSCKINQLFKAVTDFGETTVFSEATCRLQEEAIQCFTEKCLSGNSGSAKLVKGLFKTPCNNNNNNKKRNIVAAILGTISVIIIVLILSFALYWGINRIKQRIHQFPVNHRRNLQVDLPPCPQPPPSHNVTQAYSVSSDDPSYDYPPWNPHA